MSYHKLLSIIGELARQTFYLGADHDHQNLQWHQVYTVIILISVLVVSSRTIRPEVWFCTFSEMPDMLCLDVEGQCAKHS